MILKHRRKGTQRTWKVKVTFFNREGAKAAVFRYVKKSSKGKARIIRYAKG